MRDHSYSLHSLAATFVLPCYFTFYPHCVGNSEKGWERGRNPSPCSQFIIHSKFLWKPLTLNNKFSSSPSAPCLWGHSTNRFPVIMEGGKKKEINYTNLKTPEWPWKKLQRSSRWPPCSPRLDPTFVIPQRNSSVFSSVFLMKMQLKNLVAWVQPITDRIYRM